MSSIFVWDLDKEQLLHTIQSSADSGISALVSSGYNVLFESSE
jgi:regulator-associated protein of mTOR